MSRLAILSLAAAIAFAGLPPRADAFTSGDRIWLESYLAFPIENVPFTASAMGYLGRVKEVSAQFDIRDRRGSLATSRETTARFYEDGRAAEEVDTDLLTAQIVFRAVYRYNERKQIAQIARNDYAAGTVETTDFAYDAKGLLIGASMTRDGRIEKSVAIVNTSTGRPLLALTRLPDGREVSRVTYTYADDAVRVAYTGASGAERVISVFALDAQGRPVAAATQRRDAAPQVDYDGTYRYSYLADGGKLFHGVEDHPNALPHPSRCVLDREFFPNGAARRTQAVGDDITCQNAPSPQPDVAFDAQGNFSRSKLGAYEHLYHIVYYATPTM
jgi:hypothetical protein